VQPATCEWPLHFLHFLLKFPSGGTLLRALVSARVVPPSSIWAIVRSDTQAESVEHLQVNAVQVALTNEGGIQRAILDNGSTYSFYLCNEQTNH
jgi:hypothetical protein